MIAWRALEPTATWYLSITDSAEKCEMFEFCWYFSLEGWPQKLAFNGLNAQRAVKKTGDKKASLLVVILINNTTCTVRETF